MKDVATTGVLRAVNASKYVCWPGLRLGPHWGAYSTPPDTLAGFGEEGSDGGR